GARVAGAFSWSAADELVFHPASALATATCYHVDIATSATDVSGNALAAWGGSDFLVLGGTPPSVTLTSGSYVYPGGTVTASGSGWSAGTGNVVPHWDDGAVLDASG